MIGVQVVYIGGIDSNLARMIYEAAGRDVNDEGCTIQGEQRRDMFWRCETVEEAVSIAERLIAKGFVTTPAGELITVSIKSEDEHFEEKMIAIEASFPDCFGNPAKDDIP
jgi:hypothetical protein